MVDFNAEEYLPGVSVDCVIFGFHDSELKVLLLKQKDFDKWALPGGFIRREENADQAAVRVLGERTGLDDIFLKQFAFFGDTGRVRNEHAEYLFRTGVIGKAFFDWVDTRFVTLGYYALVEFSLVKAPQPDFTSDSCEWCALSELPLLILDHAEIIKQAHITLRRHLIDHPIGLNLLPKRFTMPELQALYETILDKSLDRRNFRRKLLNFGILTDTKEYRTGGAHKSPILYEFDEKQYQQALSEGLNVGW